MAELSEKGILPAGEAPLDAFEIDQLFSLLQPFPSLALGVSGGADSLCLLHAFADWRRRTGWPGDCFVVTIDHGLRAESAGEARMVEAQCRALEIQHETLAWTGRKPLSNIQAEARHARYRLFREALERRGARALVLAHHLDDQVETFLDRLTRGSGVTGLCAMAIREERGPEGLEILRPFLSVPKSRLAATLRSAGISWAEDPSNHSLAYKRVRLRQIAAELSSEGLHPDRIFKTAHNMQRADQALESWVAGVEDQFVEIHPAGPGRMALDRYAELPEEIRLRLLARLTLQVSKNKTKPRLEKLEAADRRLCGRKPVRFTLNGTVLNVLEDALVVWREAGRRLAPALQLTSGAWHSWDDRYEGFWPGDERRRADGLCFGALADAPAPSEPFPWPAGWPKMAFTTAPAIWCSSELLLVPGLYLAKGWSDKLKIRALT